MKMKEKVRKFLEEHQEGIKKEVRSAAIYVFGFTLGCVACKICTQSSDEYKIGDAILKRIPSDVKYGLHTLGAGASSENGTLKHPLFFCISDEDYEHF